MGFRPQPDIDRTIIKFRQGEQDSYQHLIDNMKAFLGRKYC